jgi:hypothetical protein
MELMTNNLLTPPLLEINSLLDASLNRIPSVALRPF